MPRAPRKNRNTSNEERQERLPARRIEDGFPREFLSRFFDDELWPEPLDLWRSSRMATILGKRLFPRVDVSETDTEVKVVADVPGIDPDNIDLDVKENRMILSGTSEREITSNERPYRYERSYGAFRREFMLPSKVEENKVKAVYKDGVLTVTIPKIEREKRKKIPIERD